MTAMKRPIEEDGPAAAPEVKWPAFGSAIVKARLVVCRPVPARRARFASRRSKRAPITELMRPEDMVLFKQ